MKDYIIFVYKNVIKVYKKVDWNVLDVIIFVDKKVVEKFGFDDWVEILGNRDLFIIIKDYKFDFMNNLSCRFINLSKLEIGIISK